MKVLQLITSTRSFFEQQVRVLESRGVECTVVRVPGEYTADSPRTPIEYLRYYPRILRAVRQDRYDLVHANYGLVAPFALAQPRRPVILTLWGTDLMSEMAWLRHLSRFGARFADATIVPSPAMADALETDHDLIPFGVDTERFRPMSRDVARERVGWTTDRPVALFPYDPARAEKNFPLARRVIDRAAVDIELRTVTDAPYEDMPYYLNASDVLLLTSHRESGPMAVKEAAACNLPIVGTDVGFVRETIDGVDNCAVCSEARAFVRAVEDIVEDGGRSNGRTAVDGLGLDVMGDRLVSVYERVLERDPGPTVTARKEDVTHGV